MRLRFLESVWLDVRYGVRKLVSTPSFTILTVLTFAIAIGGHATIFSIVNAVLIQPLPYPHPESLVAIVQTNQEQDVVDADASYPNFLDWQQQSHGFLELAGIRQHPFALTGNENPIYVDGATVSASLFPLLGVTPIRGRVIHTSDENANASPVVLVSEQLWKGRYGSDPSFIGKSLLLDNQSFTVVGVLPSGFNFPYANPPIQVWIPLVKDKAYKNLLDRRAGHYLEVVGRLKPGVSLIRAEAELSAVNSRLAGAYPDENGGWGIRLLSLKERLVGEVRTALLVLWGGVGLMLMIAGVNVTNLLLARGTLRLRELAIRISLGASRWRLVRQLLTESVLLGLTGGTLGLLFAYIIITASVAIIPDEIPRIHDIQLNGLALGVTYFLSLVIGIVVGILPALYFTLSNMHRTLQQGGRGGGTSKLLLRIRNFLVVSEISLSVLLLIGAGLLLRSFERLKQVNLGFDPDNVVVVGVSLPRAQYTRPEQWAAFYTDVLTRLKAAPEVASAAAAQPLPPNGGGLNLGFRVEGRGPQMPNEEYSANYAAVSDEYFRLLRIPLLKGRLFTDADAASSTKVCIISEKFADRFFPGEDPIGKQLIFGYLDESPREIVGIVSEVKQAGLAAPFSPQMYVPYTQNPWWAMALAIRTTIDNPANLSGLLQKKVHEVDRDLPMTQIQLMTDAINQSIAQPRFRTFLFTFCSAIAVLLAAGGVYGVISYSVSQQMHDFGIRIALGAGPRQVLQMVLAQGAWLLFIGLTIGVASALALTRYMASLLYGINAVDLPTFFSATALLLIVGLAASFFPAKRAMRIDPLVALRNE